METCVKYQPKFGRVLIKRELTSKTAGGVIIPESAAKRNAPCKGQIVALGETAGWTEAYGPGGELQPTLTMGVGDRVIFGRHAGAWLDGTSDDDATLFICQDQDILAVIKE
jgi:co-chaperonin GroES (HSP10)